MSALELAIWSMAVGAIGTVVLAGLIDTVRLRSRAALEGVGYNLSALLFVLFLSGMLRPIAPGLDPGLLHTGQVLVGTLCVFLGDFWMRGWLGAHQRDRLMELCLRTGAIVAPIAGMLALLLPHEWQLPAAGALCVANTSMVLWLSVRAWLLGDRLALGIAVGALLMLLAVMGLYAMAIGMSGITAGWQALIAAITVACVSVIGLMLWTRNQHERSTRPPETPSSQLDPVTRLRTGSAFVRDLVQAQRRRRRTQLDGAVFGLLLFNADKLQAQVGSAGLNEVYLHLANRIRRQVGAVNAVGRYWDRCFVSLVETVHSPAALRTLGLRIASSARRPLHVHAGGGQRVEVRPDVGVGVVHLKGDAMAVEDLLHEAQHMAEAARAMRSRTAMLDPLTREVVPVEHANLGTRRRAHHAPVPHASPLAHRPARG